MMIKKSQQATVGLNSQVPMIPRELEREDYRAAYESKSAIHLYIREVGEVPLLTPAEEVELAARIKRGDDAAREHMHVIEKLCRLSRSASKLQELLGRDATDEELGAEVGYTAARVASLRNAALRPASLDMSLGDDDTSRLADLVPDERVEHPAKNLEEAATVDLLHELITKLDERESRILRYRFGLDGGAERTLEEVGQELGVTRERIRQLQNVALLKLRRMIEQRDAMEIAA